MRQDALSIELQTTGMDKLAEEYGKVIENIMGRTVSARLKNTDLSGDPSAGSVEAKRFVNVQGKTYGTARGLGEGQKVKALPVTIPIDTDTEYLEEVEEKDLRMYGVAGLIERRVRNHGESIIVDDETAFFQEAFDEGTDFTPTATAIEDEIEEAIQTIETTSNDFVRGVPRNLIEVIAKPSVYGQLRNFIDTIASVDITKSAEEIGMFHGVMISSNVFLPDDVDYIVMIRGAIAQPVLPSIYPPAKVEFSDATGFGIFTYKGTKAVMPDLIIYKEA